MKQELTKEQIDRQDCVNDAILNMLQEVLPEGAPEWDSAAIGEVRDVVQQIAVEKGLTTELDFYPYIDYDS